MSIPRKPNCPTMKVQVFEEDKKGNVEDYGDGKRNFPFRPCPAFIFFYEKSETIIGAEWM